MPDLTSLDISDSIQIWALIATIIIFIVSQFFSSRRDKILANREIYQKLELSAIDLFRFEAQNPEVIRAVWDKGLKAPDLNSVEHIATMNYVCQNLSLFEMAIRFRKEKVFQADLFGSWVAWFFLLASAPGFEEIWENVREDYLPQLREVMDSGIKISKRHRDEERQKDEFYNFLSDYFDCKEIRKWRDKNTISAFDKYLKKTIKKDNSKTVSPEVPTIRWIKSDKNQILGKLFIENVSEDYISHSEIQEGRATSKAKWSSKLKEILDSEFKLALTNEIFAKSNIVGAYYGQNLLGFALVEFFGEKKPDYATVSDIVVDKNYRELGIASLILDWTFRELTESGIDMVFAESNINNHSAHALLERSGFEKLSHVFIKRL